MRSSFLSLTVLVSILTGAVVPVLSQRALKSLPDTAAERAQSKQAVSGSGRTMPIQAKGRPLRSQHSTKFGKVESFTEGRGAYIRWTMESELKNA